MINDYGQNRNLFLNRLDICHLLNYFILHTLSQFFNKIILRRSLLKKDRDMNMDLNPSNLCKEFARILGATPSVINGVCTATRSRTNIHPVVLGRNASSFMFIPQAFTFEDIDREGRRLCLGETVILQEEINPFMSRLREHGIIVTAVHNHWLFDHPRLMYMHFESIDRPLNFARKVRDAMNVLISREYMLIVPFMANLIIGLNQKFLRTSLGINILIHLTFAMNLTEFLAERCIHLKMNNVSS